jgi:hypothetical protein
MALRAHARPTLALAAAAGVLTASTAQAAVYAVVRYDMDVVTVMDPASVETVPGSDNLRRAWSVSVQRNLVSGGPQQPGYVRTLNEYDCATHKIRWTSFDVYSRFGASVMHKDNDDEAWNPILPGSEPEVSARLVCEHNNKWSAIASHSLSQLVMTLMQAWDATAPMPPLQPVAPRSAPKNSGIKKPAAPQDKAAARR